MNNVLKWAGMALLLVILGCSGKSDEKTSAANPATPAVLDPMQDKGVGPVQQIDIPATIDAEMAVLGDTLFVNKCTACHKIDARKIGPPLAGVTTRRTPEWIMNMILNPEKMVVENEAAKKLLMEYIAPMANQSLKEEEARAILEYFRSIDAAQKN